MSLTNFVIMAYRVNSYQLTALDWMQSRMFELTARVPEGATREQFEAMLQNLLTDRFGLKTHRESKEMVRYELAITKSGPKFKESSGVDPLAYGDSDYQRGLDQDGYPRLAKGRAGTSMMRGRALMFYPDLTMGDLAMRLAGQLRAPVADKTGLPGKYEIGLFWATQQMRARDPGTGADPDSDSGPTLERAIQEQLGLRLEQKKGPVDFLVVDHMEKLPTDN